MITTIGNDFTVSDNAVLSSCCGLLRLVDDTVTSVGSTDISGNATGCESVDAIQGACPSSRTLSVSQNSFTVTAAAGNVDFNVTANVPWEITQAPADDWITDIAPDSGTDGQAITIRYAENTQTQREAILTLAATDSGSEMFDITITQEAASTTPPTTPPTTPVLGLPAVVEGLRFFPNPAAQNLYVEGISQETNLIIRTFSGKNPVARHFAPKSSGRPHFLAPRGLSFDTPKR